MSRKSRSGTSMSPRGMMRANVVYAPNLGIGPALPSPTSSPGTIGGVALTTASNNWVFSWTTPSDVSQTPLYNQLRYATGSVELSDENFVASGTLWGDWAGDTDYVDGWIKDVGNGYLYPWSSVLFTTAAPTFSGDGQFGIRYMNANGNLSTIATASATF